MKKKKTEEVVEPTAYFEALDQLIANKFGELRANHVSDQMQPFADMILAANAFEATSHADFDGLKGGKGRYVDMQATYWEVPEYRDCLIRIMYADKGIIAPPTPGIAHKRDITIIVGVLDVAIPLCGITYYFEEVEDDPLVTVFGHMQVPQDQIYDADIFDRVGDAVKLIRHFRFAPEEFQ